MKMEGKESEDIEMGNTNEAVEMEGSNEALGRRQYLTIRHEGKFLYKPEIS